MGREAHHPSLSERFADALPKPTDPTPVEAMAYRLGAPEGKKLYRLRKQMPEPVFGIIKSVLGFRQFLLRHLAIPEWHQVVDDLADLSEIVVEQDGRRALLRTAPGSTIDALCRAVGITLPPVFQELPHAEAAS
jgi:hypothetical protein